MRRLLIGSAAVLLTISGPATRAAAQGSVSNGRPSLALGFTYGGQPTRGADGEWVMAVPPVVRQVIAGSNAQKAGLQVGDTIVTVNGRDARLPHVTANRAPGTPYALTIHRGGQAREIAFLIGTDVPPAKQ